VRRWAGVGHGLQCVGQKANRKERGENREGRKEQTAKRAKNSRK